MEGAARAWQLPHLTLLRMQRDGEFQPELAVLIWFGTRHWWRPSKRKVRGDDEKDERAGCSPGRDKVLRQRRGDCDLQHLLPPFYPSFHHTHTRTHIPHLIDICQLSDMLTWSCSPKTVSHCRRAVNRPIYPTPSVLKVRVAKTQPSQIPLQNLPLSPDLAGHSCNKCFYNSQ